MLILRSKTKFSDATLTGFLPSATEQAVYDMAPPLWLQGNRKFIRSGADGAFAGWADRVSGRNFVPLGGAKPGLVDWANGGTSLAFNGIAAASLVHEDNNDLFPANKSEYSIVTLQRIPSGAANTFGGALLATRGTAGILAFVSHTTGIYNYQNAFGGGGNSIADNAAQNDDGQFEWNVISISDGDASARSTVIRRNGVQTVGPNNADFTPLTSAGNLQFIIGGGGADGSVVPLRGQIGAVIVLPFAVHKNLTALTAIEALMASIRETLA